MTWKRNGGCERMPWWGMQRRFSGVRGVGGRVMKGSE